MIYRLLNDTLLMCRIYPPDARMQRLIILSTHKMNRWYIYMKYTNLVFVPGIRSLCIYLTLHHSIENQSLDFLLAWQDDNHPLYMRHCKTVGFLVVIHPPGWSQEHLRQAMLLHATISPPVSSLCCSHSSLFASFHLCPLYIHQYLSFFVTLTFNYSNVIVL